MTPPASSDSSDRYTIDRKLSEGGMAEVYLARRHESGSSRPVVIKGVLPGLVGDDDYVRMMRNEARIAASLCHPNIVRIEDLMETGGRPFIVMEYLDGRNLNEIVQRALATEQTVSRSFVCSVVTKMLAGLGHAHDVADYEGSPLGLVHRDVSLANVIVTWSGRVALIDFGIAKATEAVGDDLTRVGVIKGKTTYMSPEQVKREPLDRRSDLFSVGVVLWELLTQRRLFARKGALDSMTAICTQDAPPPSSVVADLPAALDRICARALARDREQRYQTAAEMQKDLEAVMAEANWSADDFALEAELAQLFPAESLPPLQDDADDEEELATTVRPLYAPPPTLAT
jgi:serine/threonine protein kinase